VAALCRAALQRHHLLLKRTHFAAPNTFRHNVPRYPYTIPSPPSAPPACLFHAAHTTHTLTPLFSYLSRYCTLPLSRYLSRGGTVLSLFTSTIIMDVPVTSHCWCPLFRMKGRRLCCASAQRLVHAGALRWPAFERTRDTAHVLPEHAFSFLFADATSAPLWFRTDADVDRHAWTYGGAAIFSYLIHITSL